MGMNMQNLMRQAQKMQRQMQQAQEELAQAELTGDAHHQIQRQGHHHIGADGNELALQGTGHSVVHIEHAERVHRNHKAKGSKIGTKCFLLHGITLSLESACPADRWA